MPAPPCARSCDGVLQLRAYAWPDQAPVVGRQLAGIQGVRHVVMGGSTDGGMVQITAELPTDVADAVLDVLRACDVAADDVILWRTSTIPPLG
jgi:hypothetical protein